MASTWDLFAAQAAPGVRSNLVEHLMTIAKMNGAIESMPDSEHLRKKLASSLTQLGIPHEFLARISGDVEQDAPLLEEFDVTPVVSFALLRSARTLIDQKTFETACGLMTPFVHRFPEHAEACMHAQLSSIQVALSHIRAWPPYMSVRKNTNLPRKHGVAASNLVRFFDDRTRAKLYRQRAFW